MPPLVATTSGMPEPVVCPPRPPTFLIVSKVDARCAAAIDDDLVRRRTRSAERRVHRDVGAGPEVIANGERLEAAARSRRREDDDTVHDAEVGDGRRAGHSPCRPVGQVDVGRRGRVGPNGAGQDRSVGVQRHDAAGGRVEQVVRSRIGGRRVEIDGRNRRVGEDQIARQVAESKVVEGRGLVRSARSKAIAFARGRDRRRRPSRSTEAPLPCSRTPTSEAFVVLMVERPRRRDCAGRAARSRVACVEPDRARARVVIVADARLTFAPAPSATTPLAPKPVAGDTPPAVVTVVEPVALITPPRLATTPLAPAP